ncbi:unnamed protein product, partial [Scytosiphon promiscuus]
MLSSCSAQVYFHPRLSQVSLEKRAAFVTSPVKRSLTDVPGIGPATAKKLAERKHGSVTNTYQLIGQFLSIRPHQSDPGQHCERFWWWLKAKGIRAFRHDIVLAIAEKVNIAYPG